MSDSFPHLVTKDAKRFYFGQELAEAEEVFGIAARHIHPDLARVAPHQRTIETKDVILTFDAGRLMRITFLHNFDFQIPLTPYVEEWKNLHDLGFSKDTTREEAAGYLSTWEKRAMALGAKKTECGNDLSSCEFSTYSSAEEDLDLKTPGGDWDVLGINMGKSRRAGGGGLWMDGWIIEFANARDAGLHQLSNGTILSISAFCDEFNTAARR